MNKHRAIMKASIYRKRYRCRPKYIHSSKEFTMPYEMTIEAGDELESKVIWTGNIDAPFLDKNEKFYINELDCVVTILSFIRSSNGDVTYQTDYEFDLVEDEQSLKQKEYEETLLEYMKPENVLKRKKEERWWNRFKGWMLNV